VAAQIGLPGALLLFISVAEVLGGVGLVLPTLTGIRPGLTPLAAAGLVIIMAGATVLTATGVGGGDPGGAVVPLVLGLLAAFVAYGRWRLVARRESSHRQLERSAFQWRDSEPAPRLLRAH
jgi:hypothetical protein